MVVMVVMMAVAMPLVIPANVVMMTAIMVMVVVMIILRQLDRGRLQTRRIVGLQLFHRIGNRRQQIGIRLHA